MKIKKVVIPVAGKGTRFLPATKEIPKEMIPILDRPMIHYAVEEAVKANIEEVIFVTSKGKEVIEKYFQRNSTLEDFLSRNGKEKQLQNIKNIGSMISFKTVEQKEQLGLGHAVLCAQELVGDEPFAVILGDDLILSSEPVVGQLMKVSEEKDFSPVIGVMEVPNKETFRYGIVSGDMLNDKTLKMDSMVEKPEPQNAPTNLATPGRYILTPEIFQCLKEIPRGSGGEYQLTDAINYLAKKRDVYAHIFEGDRFDTGNLDCYLNAMVEFALRDQRTENLMRNIIKEKAEKIERGLL
ncbi:MAG: UTP--glucose-1-phosphate uridylyltransferase GalU [Bacteriovoracaceae bacterium]